MDDSHYWPRCHIGALHLLPDCMPSKLVRYAIRYTLYEYSVLTPTSFVFKLINNTRIQVTMASTIEHDTKHQTATDLTTKQQNNKSKTQTCTQATCNPHGSTHVVNHQIMRMEIKSDHQDATDRCDVMLCSDHQRLVEAKGMSNEK